ncbi:MAG: hypothetical protein JWP63_6203, partial [Candidatus Solibacter sp.]|nr:hypothetical protein [Candidatus Solibacter sp.]
MKYFTFMLAAVLLFAQGKSEWVSFGPDHLLHYKADERGNRIMDFSSAGYQGGGVKLPSPAVARKLAPIKGDNTAQIQAALDGASGAVLLGPGEYEVAGTVSITKSNVVLRGDGAVILLMGKPHRFLDIHGSGTWQAEGAPAKILDAYVPAGADSFRVDGVFHAGDHVLIQRPVTDEWVHFMGMDTLVRDGKPQTWIKAGSVVRTDRVVKAVSGDRVTLDVPLSDSLDAKFTSATMVRYTFAGRLREVGVEKLRITAPFEDIPITGPQYTALRIDNVEDAWVRDLDIQETQNGITIGAAAKRVTFDNVRIAHSATHSGAAAPADFAIQGTQILLNRCAVSGDGTWPVVTQAQVTGPNVVLNFVAEHAGIAPHQRWATGLLVDGAKLPGTTERKQGLAFSNR